MNQQVDPPLYSLYRQLLRPLLFQMDPEVLHTATLTLAQQLGHPGRIQNWIGWNVRPQDQHLLQQTLWGLTFSHPLGLAAGFDKNAEGIRFWPTLGFGFVEIGTVTAQPQEGNPKPRLFRLVPDQAVLNRMGFNNQGAVRVAQRLRQSGRIPVPLGINLGKSKVTPLEEATRDYLQSWQALYPFGDYFVVNVSSPNTPGLRQLQEKDRLTEIVRVLQDHNPQQKPILVKIAPDLDWPAIDDILTVVESCRLSGVIATNTTLARQGLQTVGMTHEAGGISGQPLRSRSTAVIAYIWNQTQGKVPIIGVGGIDSVEAAWEKLVAGSSLLQLYTGLVYKGPGLVSQVVKGLVARMRREGVTSLHELIGSGAKDLRKH